MIDELRFRRLKALRETMAHPFFADAIKDLKRDLADEIADCMDPIKAGALRAERFALERVAGRLEAYTNEIIFTEKQANG